MLKQLFVVLDKELIKEQNIGMGCHRGVGSLFPALIKPRRHEPSGVATGPSSLYIYLNRQVPGLFPKLLKQRWN